MAMEILLTGEQMKRVDQDTIQRIGIPSLVLMERAALAVAEEADRLMKAAYPERKPEELRILAACGTGNNGADGIAAGRILHGWGYDVTVLLAGNPEHASPENQLQKEIASRLFVPVEEASSYVTGTCQLILDALFGIGLTRPVEGAYKELIQLLQEKKASGEARVIAVDIPSGIHSGTGAVLGTALEADVTVTFGFGKTGLYLYPGRTWAGRTVIADIGFSSQSLDHSGWDARRMTREDLARLPKRAADGNKGTFGRVLVIAGSKGMCGAAYLSALAAYRTGAGLVKVLTVPENRAILQTRLPEAIVETYETEEPEAESFRKEIERHCDWADVIVLGPGLGREKYVAYLTELVLSYAYVPVVLDADGLNAVATHPYLTRYFTENIIVTPHMGEMSRLCGCTVEELKADPVRAAKEYSSRNSAVCVLKDAATVTADKDGDVWVNTSGCSAMAKGGSGDVLTGVIAGLLARGMEGAEVAALGVYLHGLAGEMAAARHGQQGVLAEEIADCVPLCEPGECR